MGKRRGGLSGLTGFIQQAFTEDVDREQPESEPPAKKRKTNENGASVLNASPLKLDSDSKWVDKYDATGMVPHYTHASQVPENLQKYFAQRTRFLSLYSSPPGCLLDAEGWYSITPERVADRIAERCRSDTILDAFCGVGGNAIAFAKTCERVIALDISPIRLALARHNAQIYGVADRIEFILADYISFANSYLSICPDTSRRKIDVVFLSPPWGGPQYLEGSSDPSRPSSPTKVDDSDVDGHPSYSLASIQPIHGADLFRLSRRITRNVAYYLPRNMQLDEIGALLDTSLDAGEAVTAPAKEMVEVEEEWMGTKLKALTCYFGGLADGQGDLFDA
ncbi:S-adenosyl-L-methionine-dependent methyltransferase [Mycena rebaudengoi]|nr:S-adenosyl-L-methionine-dependent methyltransferase [Mycena rebaudengoi]